MRAYAKIIIEQQNAEHWLAWLADRPQYIVGGKWAADALARLIVSYGADEFETDEALSIDDETKAGHHEVRIPFRRLMKIPVPSAN